MDITDKTKPGGWTRAEVTDFLLSNLKDHSSCLAVVNTKNMGKRSLSFMPGTR